MFPSYVNALCIYIHILNVGNFTQEEIGEPILDTILEPGDVMYFPRGTIHQVQSILGFKIQEGHSCGYATSEI